MRKSVSVASQQLYLLKRYNSFKGMSSVDGLYAVVVDDFFICRFETLHEAEHMQELLFIYEPSLKVTVSVCS